MAFPQGTELPDPGSIGPSAVAIQGPEDRTDAFRVLGYRQANPARIDPPVREIDEEIRKPQLDRVVNDRPRLKLPSIGQAAGFESRLQRDGTPQTSPERFPKGRFRRGPRPDQAEQEQRMRCRAVSGGNSRW